MAEFQISQAGVGTGVANRAFTGSGADVGGGKAAVVTLTPLNVPVGATAEFFIDDVPQLPTPSGVPALIDQGGGVKTFEPEAGKWGNHRIRLRITKTNGDVDEVRRAFKLLTPSGIAIPAFNQVGDSTATIADVGDTTTIEAVEDNEGDNIREWHAWITKITELVESGGASNFSRTFTNADLVAGKLTVAHNLGQQLVHVTVMRETFKTVQPDEVDLSPGANSLVLDLGSFGTITGTWTVLVSQ